MMKCSKCGAKLPILRVPSNLNQAMWGGYTCHKCGIELDKFGQVKIGATKKIKEEKDSGLEGFKFGAGIIIGIIAIIFLFFMFFQPTLELNVNGAIQPSLNINPYVNEQPKTFCPNLSDLINLEPIFQPVDYFPFNAYTLHFKGEYNQETYSFGGNSSISVCQKGSIERQNINYYYCFLPYRQIDASGNVISQELFTVEINPLTNPISILSVIC